MNTDEPRAEFHAAQRKLHLLPIMLRDCCQNTTPAARRLPRQQTMASRRRPRANKNRKAQGRNQDAVHSQSAASKIISTERASANSGFFASGSSATIARIRNVTPKQKMRARWPPDLFTDESERASIERARRTKPASFEPVQRVQRMAQPTAPATCAAQMPNRPR